MNHGVLWLALAMTLAIIAGGCKSHAHSRQSSAPLASGVGTEETPGIVKVGDELTVEIIDPLGPQMETRHVVRVDEDGSISLPLVGRIPAAGSTAVDLQERIRRTYEDEVGVGEIEVIVNPMPQMKHK